MIKRNPIYKPLYTTDKRYILLTGGRGGAKSFEAATFLTLLSYEEWHKILFTRYTMTAAEISIIPEFKEKIDLLEVPGHFKVNSTEIQNLQSGSEILFRGIKTSSGNQTANLKSINGLTTFVVDEAEEFTEEDDFDKIDLSIRTQMNQNRVIIIMNPPDDEHFIYKKFIRDTHELRMFDGVPIEISTHPDVLHIHTTYLDNLKNLSPEFVKIAEKMKSENPKNYAHKMLGKWIDIADGSLFQEIKFYKPSDVMQFESSFAYIDVADEGIDFTCMVVGRTIGNTIYIVDVVFSDLNADATIPMCAAAIKKNNISFIRCESNAMGAIFGRNLQRLVPECKIMGISSNKNKHTRIMMESVFVSEFCRFIDNSISSPQYRNFISHLTKYTKDGKYKKDDAPDALTGLTIFIRSILRNVYA